MENRGNIKNDSKLMGRIFERYKIQFHGKVCIRQLGYPQLPVYTHLTRGKGHSCPRFTPIIYSAEGATAIHQPRKISQYFLSHNGAARPSKLYRFATAKSGV